MAAQVLPVPSFELPQPADRVDELIALLFEAAEQLTAPRLDVQIEPLGQALRISASPIGALTRARRQILIIIDSITFVERNVRACVGGRPRRSTIRVAASPPRGLAAAPWWVLYNSAASASSCAWAARAESAW